MQLAYFMDWKIEAKISLGGTFSLSWQTLQNIAKAVSFIASFAFSKYEKVITKNDKTSLASQKMRVLNYPAMCNFGLLWRRKRNRKRKKEGRTEKNGRRLWTCSCVWVATFWGIFMVCQGFLCTKCHQFTAVYHIFYRIGNIKSYFYTILNKLGYFLPVFFVWSVSDDI